MHSIVGTLTGEIVQTTAYTTLAAVVAFVFLHVLEIRSPSIHRITWVLVILQGWILTSVTITVSVPQAVRSQQGLASSIESIDQLLHPRSQAILDPNVVSTWLHQAMTVAFGVWIMGAFAVVASHILRYRSLITHLPIGIAPDRAEWDREWQEAFANNCSRSNVSFRITNNFGPVLCFVPFAYLVLVPRLLWSSLNRDDRIGILRHELAHLERGDLWKNLVVHALALPQWFNPFVWLAVRRFEEAGEWACDETVLASTTLANNGYAGTLLRVAGFPAESGCGSVAASGGVLTRRITRLLSSSDKEVSRMKNLALPLLLVGISVGQAFRIDSVVADEPERSVRLERAKAVTQWREGPYIIEPPDILSIVLKWKDFDATIKDSRFQASDVQLSGHYLVEPDGTIDVTEPIDVVGMTVDEAKATVRERLAEKLGECQIELSVWSFNSKVVYVIDDTGPGSRCAAFPCDTEATVLRLLNDYTNDPEKDLKDYLDSEVYVLPIVGSTKDPNDRMHVDLRAILSKKDLTTNYALLPGDRICIEPEGADVAAPRPASGTRRPEAGGFF